MLVKLAPRCGAESRGSILTQDLSRLTHHPDETDNRRKRQRFPRKTDHESLPNPSSWFVLF